MNKMIKTFLIVLMAATTTTAFAHHHHHHGTGFAIGAGILGAGLLASTIYDVQNVWVEGRYIDQPTPQGGVVRTWQPGHYEQQQTQVWVTP